MEECKCTNLYSSLRRTVMSLGSPSTRQTLPALSNHIPPLPRNDLNFPLQIIFASANSAILDVFRVYYLAKIEFFKAELKTCSLFVALTPKAHARHVRFQDTLRSLKSECRHLERKHASKWSSSRALPLPGPPPFDTCTVHPPRSLGTVLG